MNRRNLIWLMAAMLITVAAASAGSENESESESPDDIKTKLAEWRKGVWISGEGTFTIYTDDHYFVLSYEGDTASPNLYFGASQFQICNQGSARGQVLRYRKGGNATLEAFRNDAFREDHTEEPMAVDTTLFTPGACNIKDGIIYDAVTEVTDEYIIMATCGGDRVKLFNNGVSVYLPKSGGEYYSYRVEKF